MRRPAILPVVVAALLAACSGETADQAADDAPLPPNPTVEAVADLAEVAEYWETHYNMGHPDMVVSTMIEDAMMWDANGRMVFGRDAVQAAIAAEIEMASPEVQIEQQAARVFGNMAVMRGTYSVNGMAEGESFANSGYWMALAENVGGEWKLHGVIGNADSEDQPLMPGEGMEMPPGEGADLITERTDYYATHFNMGHASMVADVYSDDAVVMASGREMVEGREATLATLTELTDAGAQLSIAPWSAHALGDDAVGAAGTYTLEIPGEPAIDGHFAALYERGADGELMIEWLLTAAHPNM